MAEDDMRRVPEKITKSLKWPYDPTEDDAASLATEIVQLLLKNAKNSPWIGTHGEENEDLSNLTIDGTFDLKEVAKALNTARVEVM